MPNEHLEAHHKVSPAARETLLAMADEGLSNAGLAERFGVSEAAIASRLTRFYGKTGLTRSEAIAFVARHRRCCLSA